MKTIRIRNWNHELSKNVINRNEWEKRVEVGNFSNKER
jgi:hypothetical protein